MKKKFKCEIDCAACADKVEREIAKIDGVNSVRVNFLSQKITLDADEDKFDSVLKAAQKAGKKIDSDFSIEM